MNGYIGKLLWVDLTESKIEIKDLDEKLAKKYLGGNGLACRMLYDMVDKDTDPLGEENVLIVMTGPLTGTFGPCVGKYAICAKSPLTDIWGESNSGGKFGPELKYAGFDGIVFTGKAPKPVYLFVKDGKAELRDAKKVWGKEVTKTQEKILKELKDEKIKIAAIGPAGENLVKYACVINDFGRAAGRTGMGAVMGSKNLKAIAVRGRGGIAVANSNKLLKDGTKALDSVKSSFVTQMFGSLGTSGYWDYAATLGDLSFKYFTEGSWDDASKISGSALAETVLVNHASCFACPISCGRVVNVKEGDYKTKGVVKGTEYETLGSFGAALLVNDVEAIQKANEICDEIGVDTISAGVTIAYAYYLYDKGVLKKEDVGFELKWGDIDPALKLLELIAKREGFGDILAEGSYRMAEKFKQPFDEVAAVNKMEVPFHDPRAFFGMALVYATSWRGACHMTADNYQTDLGQPQIELGIIPGDRQTLEGKAASVASLQDYRSLYGAAIMCNFSFPPAEEMANLFSDVIGNKYKIDDLKVLGERLVNLKRVFNIKMGLTSENDKLPAILLEPLDGGTEGKVPDMDILLKEYYDHRNWDPETGKPNKEKLEELGLDEFIDDVWGSDK
ncbi:MAG: aldehyde ferredoxin oxidoreductase [Promethearchaeota archaeon]|nr:MAG: aldehyde ferredoxin oxidoreductase [Candidatus Lokiarchaeota archaeon]